MGLLEKLFGMKPREPEANEIIGKIIDRFATATIMGLDREDLGRFPAKQYKVMAFHYGAIEELCRRYAVDEDHMLGIFVVFIDKYFNMPVFETGSITERLQGFYSNPEERRYLEAGKDIFLRWHDENDRRAPLELGVMLKDA